LGGKEKLKLRSRPNDKGAAYEAQKKLSLGKRRRLRGQDDWTASPPFRFLYAWGEGEEKGTELPIEHRKKEKSCKAKDSSQSWPHTCLWLGEKKEKKESRATPMLMVDHGGGF